MKKMLFRTCKRFQRSLTLASPCAMCSRCLSSLQTVKDHSRYRARKYSTTITNTTSLSPVESLSSSPSSPSEHARLLTLLEDRLLRLSEVILRDDRSSIGDRVAAIDQEIEVLRSRGFEVPNQVGSE